MYSQGEYPSLSPWGANTIHYDGWDDGGKEYILPDGYEVTNDMVGSPQIWGPDDRVWELVGNDIRITDGEQYITLNPAN